VVHHRQRLPLGLEAGEERQINSGPVVCEGLESRQLFSVTFESSVLIETANSDESIVVRPQQTEPDWLIRMPHWRG
jgi:hypothetical protein